VTKPATHLLLHREIGHVNQFLKAGWNKKREDRAELRERIRGARKLAVIWYARLVVSFLNDIIPRIAIEVSDRYGRLAAQPLGDAIMLEKACLLRTRFFEVHAHLAVLEDAIGEEDERLTQLCNQLRSQLLDLGQYSLPRWELTLYEYRERHKAGVSQWDVAQLWEVCDLAIVDYRFKSPHSRATRRWQATRLLLDGEPIVVCALCKGVLRSRRDNPNGKYTRETNEHTIFCALWFLAFDEDVDVVKDQVVRESTGSLNGWQLDRLVGHPAIRPIEDA
jgi:hypothetical protein